MQVASSSRAECPQAMGTMNKRMNIPALAKIMKEFERQNAKMDQVEEMMGDAMDDVFEVCHPHVNEFSCTRQITPLHSECCHEARESQHASM